MRLSHAGTSIASLSKGGILQEEGLADELALPDSGSAVRQT